MTNLACSNCGFANEEGRVFCQNCGKRLSPADANPTSTGSSKLKVPPVTPAPESARANPTDIRSSHLAREERLRRQSRRRQDGALFMALFFSALRISLICFLIAIIIQMLRPPDAIPVAIENPNEEAATQFTTEIQAAETAANNTPLTISTAAANNYLAVRVIGKKNESLGRLERCYIVPGPTQKTICFGSENTLYKFSVFVELLCRIESNGRMTHSTIERISIGHLVMPSFLQGIVASSFDQVFTVIAAPLSWLKNSTSLEITPEGGIAQWKKI